MHWTLSNIPQLKSLPHRRVLAVRQEEGTFFLLNGTRLLRGDNSSYQLMTVSSWPVLGTQQGAVRCPLSCFFAPWRPRGKGECGHMHIAFKSYVLL